MALLISGVQYETREIKLSAKPAAMIEASPKATVPVLVLADGVVIDESIAVMRWALRQHDPERWLDGDDQALITANDQEFKHHLDRYKYPQRHASEPMADRRAGMAILADLDSRLAQNGGNFCGPNRMLADIALFPFIRQFAATDQDWFSRQPLPALQEWLTRHCSSDLFEKAMVKQPVWDGPCDLRQ